VVTNKGGGEGKREREEIRKSERNFGRERGKEENKIGREEGKIA
jgi:hypothetical protein